MLNDPDEQHCARSGVGPARRRRPAREELEALGPVSGGAPVGDRSRGLFRRWLLVEGLSLRALDRAGLPLGRGWPARHLRPRMPALLLPHSVEWVGSVSQGTALRTHRAGGQSRRGRQRVLLLSRFHSDAFVSQGALQVSAASLPLSAVGRGERDARKKRARRRATGHPTLRSGSLL